eukprot:gnl/TRDRNA2_/TRDRNA2_141088_c0_seq3.p1 gnl/TRDRNA2_/TRDRNA2_141088_c0~~gnl/TRDRNA2_/TRDRNA2_141088_c0_seq3.p1  ORF type:complete len:267 (-),score=29.87 gnl/TRDRNA2_/TRDRNA2_141088_c0_seq3:166-966(-)
MPIPVWSMKVKCQLSSRQVDPTNMTDTLHSIRVYPQVVVFQKRDASAKPPCDGPYDAGERDVVISDARIPHLLAHRKATSMMHQLSIDTNVSIEKSFPQGHAPLTRFEETLIHGENVARKRDARVEWIYDDILATRDRLTIRNVLALGTFMSGSAQALRDVFQKATMWTVDIAPLPDHLRDRMAKVQGDVTDPQTFADVPRCQIIWDDASHAPRQQLATFNLLWSTYLEPGGFYVIEGLEQQFQHPKDKPNVFDFIEKSILEYIRK